MELTTKYFGQIAYEAGDVLYFKDGLFGFEEETQFLLLPFADSNGTLLCFQSVTTPGLAFVAMNPFSLKQNYAPRLRPAELKAMGVTQSEELSFYVLCVVRQPVSESTVNLKCPVAVNEDTGTAMQTILEDGGYEMRHRLSEFQEGQSSC
ncbi:flagellar assembly protein FliW [Oscillibacter sp. GMB15532]|uniref:flagellar assembly protein FliW n=1 Tax=Oscillibacter sp. GMB15532 TaxID=3230022 RepID=UPI0034DE6453